MRRREGIYYSDPILRGKTWYLFRRGAPGDPAHGKWLPFSSKEAAQRRKRDLDRHQTHHRTVAEAVQEYLGWMERAKRSAKKTIEIHTYLLNLIFSEPAASLTEIGPRHYKQLAEGGAVAVATHHVALRIGRQFLDWCCDEERLYLRTNPLKEVKAIGRARRGKVKLRMDAFAKFIDVAFELAEGGSEEAAAVLALAFSGARPSEVLNRTVQDLDEGGAVFVIDVNDGDEQLKTEDSARGIRLDEPGLPYLARFRALLLNLTRGRLPMAPLFRVVSYRTFSKMVHTICHLADVPKVCPYSFRGLAGTIGLRQGRTAADVARGLGNTAKILRAHYAEPGAEQQGQQGQLLRLVASVGQSATKEDVPEAAEG